jgi:hypothetical protein
MFVKEYRLDRAVIYGSDKIVRRLQGAFKKRHGTYHAIWIDDVTPKNEPFTLPENVCILLTKLRNDLRS